MPLLFLLTTVYSLCILYIHRRDGGDAMLILIDNKSGAPIYEQIYGQIKGHILSGRLQAEEALPSIRALAKDLRISVITTKRAYEELEKDGYLYTVPGKGCFVAERSAALVREEHLKQIEGKMTDIRALAQTAGLTREEILEMWNLMWEVRE